MSFATLTRRVADELRAVGPINSIALLKRLSGNGNPKVSYGDLLNALQALRVEGVAKCEEPCAGAGLEWFVPDANGKRPETMRKVAPSRKTKRKKRKAQPTPAPAKKTVRQTKAGSKAKEEKIMKHAMAALAAAKTPLGLREIADSVPKTGMNASNTEIYAAVARLVSEAKVDTVKEGLFTLYKLPAQSTGNGKGNGAGQKLNGHTNTDTTSITFNVPGRGPVILTVPAGLSSEDWEYLSDALSIYAIRAAKHKTSPREAH